MLPAPRNLSEYFAFGHESHFIRENGKDCVEDLSKYKINSLNRNRKKYFHCYDGLVKEPEIC